MRLDGHFKQAAKRIAFETGLLYINYINSVCKLQKHIIFSVLNIFRRFNKSDIKNAVANLQQDGTDKLNGKLLQIISFFSYYYFYARDCEKARKNLWISPEQ